MSPKDPTSPAAELQFGPVHVVEPRSQHTHTVVLLHGRGSCGEEFAGEILEARLSNGKTLPEQLPTCRWVFPSSPPALWSTAFREAMPAWFDAYSLTDVSARQDLQVHGIRGSAEYLAGLLREEVDGRLGGAADRVVLGGISQGGAVALWTLLLLLCAAAGGENPAGRLGVGGFVGASTWLPFAEDLARYLIPGWERGGSGRPKGGVAGDDAEVRAAAADAFVESMAAPARRALMSPEPSRLRSVPVFLGHGTDDAYVDVGLGRQAARVLSELGLRVEWREYSGADQEGHWLKEPEELDDIARFLALALGLD